MLDCFVSCILQYGYLFMFRVNILAIISIIQDFTTYINFDLLHVQLMSIW